MRTGLRKLTATGAVVLLATLGLVACGGEDEAGASGDTSSVGEDAGVELTQENFFTEVTKAQLEAGTSHVEMSVGMGGESLEGKGDVAVGEDAEDTAMTMTLAMGQQGSLEMRLVDAVFYLNFGPMTDNKFARVDLTDEDNPMAEQYSDLLDNIDPAAQVEQLQDAVTGFEAVGSPTEIDGVEAQPYEIRVDGAELAERSGVEEEQSDAIPDEIVYTMFVGPDNLPRRIVADVAGSELSMDYSKWGEDVEITAPAESEITDKDPFAGFGSAA